MSHAADSVTVRVESNLGQLRTTASFGILRVAIVLDAANACGPLAICTNTPGSFTCACPPDDFVLAADNRTCLRKLVQVFENFEIQS